jgi:hypothetical protein
MYVFFEVVLRVVFEESEPLINTAVDGPFLTER